MAYEPTGVARGSTLGMATASMLQLGTQKIFRKSRWTESSGQVRKTLGIYTSENWSARHVNININTEVGHLSLLPTRFYQAACKSSNDQDAILLTIS